MKRNLHLFFVLEIGSLNYFYESKDDFIITIIFTLSKMYVKLIYIIILRWILI